MVVVGDDLAGEPAQVSDGPTPATAPPRRRWRMVVGAVVLLALAALLVTWVERERLLRGYIVEQIRRAGLPATFRVVSVGTGRQVLADIVVGDPARPDLTIDRIEVSSASRFGIPGLGEVKVVHPRLRGSYRDGVVSFGSLDKLLFGPARSPGQPRGLPDIALSLVDGRATIALDRGHAELAVSGSGGLGDGFAGRLVATAPDAGFGACNVQGFGLDAKVTVAAGRPRIAGPLRLGAMACPSAGLALGPSAAELDASIGAALDTIDGALVARAADPRLPGIRAAALRGTVRLSHGAPGTSMRYDVSADALATPQLAARTVKLSGVLRAMTGSAHATAQGSVSASGVGPGPRSYALLDDAVRTGSASFAGALLGRLRGALRREAPASTLSGEYLLRHDASYTSFGVPRLDWRTAGGEPLLSLSGVQGSIAADGPPSLAGRFATAGPDMPRLSGTIARDRGGFTLHATMARYDAGTASAALPRLTLVGLGGESIGIAGEARISGDLPGGAVRELVLPITGTWTQPSGLALWPRCTEVAFDALRLANLTLDARRLQLCPPSGGAIVRGDARGLRIAAGAPALALTGRLGATPVRLRTGAVGFAMPGTLTARAIDVSLGPEESASRFVIADLAARIGHDVTGRFAGSRIALAAVPLDLVDAGGAWRYAGGRLTIADGALRLIDREQIARFQPLVARGATLTLADNRIVADALLREPTSDRPVVRTHIVHDLGRGRGSAGLFVDGLTFDKQVQPDTLTRLALGVVANAAGTVHGTGRIDWSPRGVTSSGQFGTDALDLAAAFGPARGISGTIVFSDLLGLVTPPGQTLHVASVNPGIEATDGTIAYALRPGTAGQHVLAVEGGRWPFLGGTLTLEPASMTIGAAETRHFALSIEALDAARLIQQMDLQNLAVTGVFDGRLPLVIDQDGSRIEGGTLRSRAPGGNVSYVGELTYKDLSPMANFAFDALKSLNYRQMSVGIDGALTGELVTRLQFTGVTQGAGAKRNFLTERIARLPIQFNVNVRAPFVQLISSFRSLWDPAFIRDPRELGLIAPDGTRRDREVQPSASGPVR